MLQVSSVTTKPKKVSLMSKRMILFFPLLSRRIFSQFCTAQGYFLSKIRENDTVRRTSQLELQICSIRRWNLKLRFHWRSNEQLFLSQFRVFAGMSQLVARDLPCFCRWPEMSQLVAYLQSERERSKKNRKHTAKHGGGTNASSA